MSGRILNPSTHVFNGLLRSTTMLAAVFTICSMPLMPNPSRGQTVIDNGQEIIVPDTQASPWSPGFLYIGNNGTGSLIIHQGGIVNADEAAIGVASGGIGTVILTDPGSQWNVSGLSIGNNGTGNLTVSSGAVLTSQGNVSIGNALGSEGTVTVTGSGSQLHSNSAVGGGFAVGHFGKGELTIADGGVVTSDAAIIGNQSAASGTVAVSGPGSRWDNAQELVVSGLGTGILRITDGGVVANASGYIGYGSTGSGQVAVSGSGSQWNNSSILIVGNSGTGILEISDGGVVSGSAGYIGFLAGSNGAISVNGAGSHLALTNNLIVGSSGRGTLEIFDGGRVSSLVGAIGAETGSLGSATVSGSGSSWSNESSLYIGGYSNGTLNISDGGTVSNTSSVIGSFAGAKGIVSVSGANSHWISSDNVTVGASGEGTLEISEQGRVQASGVELALDAGSIGTINIGTGGRAGLLDTPTVTGGAGEANVNFNHVEEIAFDPMLSGALDVHKDNTGATILMAENDYTGLTTIDGGILGAGAANVFSSNSDHIVNTNGMLVLGGFSQTVLNLANAGLVNMGIDTAPGTVLTVAGNYLGNDGAVHFNTVLGDDASATDLLVVAGDTSGSTSVKVTNAGGAGAQTVEGIKIIDVGGASEGSFTLLGDYETLDNKQAIRGGAYAYTLQHNGISTPDDGNWYLRSTFQEPPVEPGQPEEPGEPAEPGQPGTPRYDAGAPVYEAYPQALLALNGLPTLQQRVGNRVWAGNGNKVIAEGADVIGTPYAAPEETGTHIEGNGVWGRIEGAHNHIEVGRSTTDVDYDQNTFKMQAGVDGMLMENEIGKLIGGISVHYAHGLTKTASIYDAKTGGGRISTDGYGLGGTLTWYGENGLYIDAQAQATWYNSDLSYAGGNQSLIDGNDGFGYALSIEGGKRIALDPAWSLTPQAQLFYSSVDFDDFHDADNIAVRLDRGESLQGRLGVTLDHQTAWQNASGMLDRAHIYGIANLYYEFLEGTRVNIADVSFANRKDRLWGGIGLGGSYNWNEDKYSIYGEGLVNTSLNSFADSYSLQGNIGFRVKW